jgi:hypothetical protein
MYSLLITITYLNIDVFEYILVSRYIRIKIDNSGRREYAPASLFFQCKTRTCGSNPGNKNLHFKRV